MVKNMENTPTNDQKYMLVVNAQTMAILAALIPQLQYVLVDGIQKENENDFVYLVNPKPTSETANESTI